MNPNKITVTLLIVVSTLSMIVSGQLISETGRITALEAKQSQWQHLKTIDDQIIAKSQTGFGISSQMLESCENFRLSGVESGASDLNTVMAQVNPILMDRKSALKDLGY